MCATQWRAGGMGSRTGLDYTAVLRTLETYLPRWQREERAQGGHAFEGLEVTDLMESIQIIEHATLCADAERRERDKAEPA